MRHVSLPQLRRRAGVLFAGLSAAGLIGCPRVIDVWIPEGSVASAPTFALAVERSVWFGEPEPVHVEELTVTRCGSAADTLWALRFHPDVPVKPLHERASLRELPRTAAVGELRYGALPNSYYRHQHPPRPLEVGGCYDVAVRSREGGGGVGFAVRSDGWLVETER